MRNVHTATNLWQTSAACSLLHNGEHPWNSEVRECSPGSASWVQQGQICHDTCQIHNLVSSLYHALLCPEELLGGKRGNCDFSAAQTWLKDRGRKRSKSRTQALRVNHYHLNCKANDFTFSHIGFVTYRWADTVATFHEAYSLACTRYCNGYLCAVAQKIRCWCHDELQTCWTSCIMFLAGRDYPSCACSPAPQLFFTLVVSCIRRKQDLWPLSHLQLVPGVVKEERGAVPGPPCLAGPRA